MMLQRNFFSSARVVFGSPRRCGIETPETNRFTFIWAATETRFVMRTAGIPFRSSSLAIAAPQRVHEPHVDVRMAPLAPSCLISVNICRAICSAISG